jgi:drug/metabolite transporter (DMT)-like permease
MKEIEMTTRTDTDVRRGIGLAVGAALISGVAIYLNAFAVKQLPDAAVYTTLKNGVAAFILLGAALALGAARELPRMSRQRWSAVLAVGVIGGSVPFVLFFSGLAQASAPSAAFIQKTLFVWVALLAVPFLGERLGPAPLAALGILLAGQLLILPPTGIVWGNGETLILAATALWAVETILVKRMLASVPSGLMAALRMSVGLVVLVGYLVVSGKASVVQGLTSVQWGWALLTGLVLAGYVATWFGALRLAPASMVTSVLVLGAVVTGTLSALDKGALPTVTTLGGYTCILVGVAIAAVWWGRASERSPMPQTVAVSDR